MRGNFVQDQEQSAQRCGASEAICDAILCKRTRIRGHSHDEDRLLARIYHILRSVADPEMSGRRALPSRRGQQALHRLTK
jgi:hypothetical protein